MFIAAETSSSTLAHYRDFVLRAVLRRTFQAWLFCFAFPAAFEFLAAAAPAGQVLSNTLHSSRHAPVRLTAPAFDQLGKSALEQLGKLVLELGDPRTESTGQLRARRPVHLLATAAGSR